MPMSGYTKLFNSILASTIWRADDKTRIVWITMLAMADRTGYVESSIPGLADFARVPLEDCLKSLEILQGPDEFSRSKESDGRRIESVEGGWNIINHNKYRNKLSQDERREYLRIKQREYRSKHKSTLVNNVSDTDTVLTHAEAEAEAEADTKADTEASTVFVVPVLSKEKEQAQKYLSSADADFDRFRQAYPASRRQGGKLAKSAWKTAIMAGHNGNGDHHLAQILAALEQHKRSEQWQNPKLIPLMTTWLNQERWNQVLPEPKPYTMQGKTGENVPALQRWLNRKTPS